MKVTTLLLSASIAWAAPLTIVRISGEKARLQKPVVVAIPKHPHFFTDALSLKEQEEQDEAQSSQAKVHFDNRPFSPTETESPSEALSTPRPLHTEYLQSLFKSSSARKQRPGSKNVPVVVVTKEDIQELSFPAKGSSIVEMETAASRPARRPCHHHLGSYAHQYVIKPRMDVLVVGVFGSFFALVLLIEAWGFICASARRIFRHEGTIRLEEAQSNEKYAAISTEDSIATLPSTHSTISSEKATAL